MFRTIRRAHLVIALAAFAGVSVTGVVGWLTGFFAAAWSAAGDLWLAIVDWFTQPWSIEHLWAAGGFLLAPLIILMIVFAVVENR